MPEGELHAAAQFIHGLVVDADLASQSENELLKRFLANRDEMAFVALVQRHGPMVLAVCRRILRDPQDAEDAFQATFLVFVRKAASIARPELLGNWLYGVASRTARVARAAAEKRRVKEAESVLREPPAQESPWQELLPFLDRELNRMPAKYRLPLVLCHLQEKSRQEAARVLGLPEGTLSSRLARGRALLALRLTRWCPSVAGEVFLGGLGKQALAAPLVQTTIKAGMSVLAGQPIKSGLVSGQVALLSQGVLRSMYMTKLKIAAAVLCVGSLLAFSVRTAASRGFGSQVDSPIAVDDSKSPGDVTAAKGPSDPLMKQVLETTRNITDAQAKLRVLLRIALVQDKTGDEAGARKTRHEAFELAKDFAAGRPRAEALLTVAQSQIKAKDRVAALETLKEAEQAVAAIVEGFNRLNVNEKSGAMWRLVSAQASIGDFEGGLRTLAKGGSSKVDLFQRFGYELNIEDKEAARKSLTQALSLMVFDDQQQREVKKAANGINEDIYVSPSKATAGLGIAYGFAKIGDLQQALEVAAKMGKEKDTCLAQIASFLARNGDIVGAARTAKGIQQDGALNAIACAQAKAGDIAGAARTAEGIQQDYAKAGALNAVVDAQVKAGDLTAARSTLKEVRTLVDRYQAREREGGPRQQRLRDRQLEELQLQIALRQLDLGDMTGALVTVANIESDPGKAEALYRIAGKRLKAGKPAEAREMLLAASQAAQRAVPTFMGKGRGPDHSEKARLLSSIAVEQAKVGDLTEAFRTANTIPADQAVDEAFAGIAPVQAEAGDLKGALETVARIRDEASKEDALEHLAQALARAGREKDALALVAQQKTPAVKARALLGVILGLGEMKAKVPEK